jgi:hypothetical protein
MMSKEKKTKFFGSDEFRSGKERTLLQPWAGQPIQIEVKGGQLNPIRSDESDGCGQLAARAVAGSRPLEICLRGVGTRVFFLSLQGFPAAAAAAATGSSPRELEVDPHRERRKGAMAAAGDAARCSEIPGRCHHCSGPLSKDMVRLLPGIVLLPLRASMFLLGLIFCYCD